MGRRFKQLSKNDRLKIETLTNAGHKPKEIAEKLHVHISTIYRELGRGRYTHLNSDLTTEERYSPDIAHARYLENLAAKGPGLKIGNNIEYARFIEDIILSDDCSPAAALVKAKNSGKFNITICVSTLYSYIDDGLFLNLTNKHLPEKGKRKRAYHKVKKQQARASRGESIENRPEEVESREEMGHWEMDCVEGKKGTKKTLLVLTERKTRVEIVILMKDKTAASVVKALDRLERKFGKMFYKIFQTITVDNGSEFADCDGIERAKYRKRKRTHVYYCHPYSSYERGSNENQNRMIRRKYPKGTDFTNVKQADIEKLNVWINDYPRRILGYATAAEMFQTCLATLC